MAVLLALPRLPPAQSRQLELGLEGFAYRSATTPLNRDDVLGLDDYPGLGPARPRLAGDARSLPGGLPRLRRAGRGARPGDETDWVVRQGYAQYWWGEKVGLRVGKQRVAWGSGFAWNPTNRLEPPKNAFNTTLEQEGALAARLDWAPSSRLSLVLVAASTDAQPRDLPAKREAERRDTAALRARVVVKDTDLALVASAGKNQRTLFGLDVGRDLAGVTWHAEAAVYQGAEVFPPREGRTFTRLVAGALRASGDDAFALEYFWNGEGYSDAATSAWLAGLDRAWLAATNPALSPEQQQQALGAYAAGASIPYAWGLGLRRHYLHVSWTRGGATSAWTGALRTVIGLDDGAWALTPGIGYAPRGNVTLNVDGVVLLGPESSEYRLSPIRGSLQARVKVLF